MNKMFKKLMAVTATVAMAASMSVSAFAAESATHTNGSVSVSGYTAVEDATQYTVMVFSCASDADITKVVPANSDAIYYINQDTDPADLLTGMLVKATGESNDLPDGDYVIRIGNDTATVTNIALNVTTTVITKDYITATEAGKATVTKLAATASGWLFDGMSCRVTIALDETAYNDFSVDSDTGLYAKNYTLTPVDADGEAIEGAEIYFAQQTGKYVALIPSTATSYKFEVTAGSNTNTALGLYGDANANGKVDATDKTIAGGLVSGKNKNATFTSTNQRKLRLDVNGDGKFNATDKTVLAGNVKGKIATLPVFAK